MYHGSWDGLQAAADMAKYLKDRGMIVTYNHPIWSRVEGADFLDTPCVDIADGLLGQRFRPDHDEAAKSVPADGVRIIFPPGFFA